MFGRFRSLLAQFGALSVFIGVIFLIANGTATPEVPTTLMPASAERSLPVDPDEHITPLSDTADPREATAKAAQTEGILPTPKAEHNTILAPEQTKIASTEPDSGGVTRLKDPYTTPPLPFSVVNDAARAALVNIICMPRAGGSLRPVSASGVIIDPRGVILTNAHVAQYVLLSEDPRVDLGCVIRTGSPALPRWNVEVLYIPPVWVSEHAADIRTENPLGTGEHDHALLRITGGLAGEQVSGLNFLHSDTREGVTFRGDQVLIAAYPAELLGALTAGNSFYPVSSVSEIARLLTFVSNSIDVFSFGGVITAQSGSSGGAVVNAWGQLVGIISTTSDGESTADRDLHALTLAYIDRDITAQTGYPLSSIVSGDITAEAAQFERDIAPRLRGLYFEHLQTK